MRRTCFLLTLLLLSACATSPSGHDDTVTLSIVGLNDIHGRLSASDTNGGLVSISAYVNALRAARADDGGAVLVVDAGDMWQGTLESNLVEGASMVEAYNALGVQAATIGNHEFDFGPVGPESVPTTPTSDPRGALKAGARAADFPLLAANLLDEATGELVTWDNVQPSVLLDIDGMQIGVIGVLTRGTLRTTIAANTHGLQIGPLAEAITRETQALREAGASLVIVVAHAGSFCAQIGDPEDLSSCDSSTELIRVARQLEPGAVDHIFGGHLSGEMSHIVNGISISMNNPHAYSFGRVDFRIDRAQQEVVGRTLFPPQVNVVPHPASYEGYPAEPIAEVERIAVAAAVVADRLQNEKLGVVLEKPFPLERSVESALSNLVTEALFETFDVDVVLHNVNGGLRRGLPAGELTFGAVYEMFPFDKVLTLLDIPGSDLRRVIGEHAKTRRRLGFAGMRVFIDCSDQRMQVRMLRNNGTAIQDDDRVTVLTNDYLALGGDNIFTPIIPEGGFDLRYDGPRTRDALVEWFRRHGGRLDPADWRSVESSKWNPSDIIPADCAL
mgnify:FL=1